ncbi:MAG: hypothetical protein ACC662_09530, partial [Planctomycetota bacterium]
LPQPLPELAKAKQAATDGRATFADRFVLLLRAATLQDRDAMIEAWKAARARAGDAPGADVVEAQVLIRARHHPEALAVLERLAEALGKDAKTPGAPGAPARSWRARWLDRRAQPILGPEEHVGFLRRIADAWKAGGPDATLAYERARARAPDAAGRAAKARNVRARIVEAHPFDLEAIGARARDLEATGRGPDATVFLERKVAPRDPPAFTKEEQAALFTLLTDHLWRRRDLEGLDRALGAWTEATPAVAQAWRSAKSLAYLQGRVEETDAWVEEVLEDRVSDDPRTPAFARLDAALSLALGNGWLFSARRVEPRFLDPLLDLGLRLAATDRAGDRLEMRLLQHWRFRNTDARRRLLEGLRAQVVRPEAVSTMDVRIFVRNVLWLDWQANAVAPDVFAAFAGAVETRGSAAGDAREKRALGDLLVSLYDAHGDREKAVEVFRKRFEAAKGLARTRLARRYFERLLSLDWTQGREDTVLALLPALLREDGREAERATVAAAASRRLAVWAFAGRKQRALGKPEDRVSLTRAQARDLERRATDEARAGLVERLTRARDALLAPFARWLELERLGYAVERDRDLAAVEAEARELLDGVPAGTEARMDRLLARRALLVLEYAATRREPPEGLVGRVLDLL